MKYKQVMLGDLYNISSGLSKGKEFFGQGYPFLSFKTVYGNYFIPEELEDLADTTDQERSVCSIKTGDVFLTRTSENTDDLGMSTVALKDYPNATFNGFTKRLRPKDGVEINPVFAGFWFRTKYFRELVKSMAVITTRASLNNEMINRLTIPVPTIEVQNAIANSLDCINSKISNNTKIIRFLEQMAQATYKSWFVENASDDWEYIGLGSVTTEIRTKAKSQQLPVLSAVRTGNLVLSEDYFIKQVYSKDTGKYIIVEPDNFAYNPARVNIGSLGMNCFDFAGCVSPVYVVFRTEPEYHHFFDFFLKSPNFQEEVKIRASGSVRQALNYKNFALIEVLYPSLKVVQSFNNQYNAMLGMIRHFESENTHLSEIRDAILPRLMSGELTVED